MHILNKNHFWSTVYTQQIHPHIPKNTEFEWLFINEKTEKAFSIKGCTINYTIKLPDRRLAHEYSEVPNKNVTFLTLDSGINVGVRLLILGLFSSGYMFMKFFFLFYFLYV